MSSRKGKKSHPKYWELYYSEVSALKHLSHPNVVTLLDYSENSTAVREDRSKVSVIYLALEYIKNGEIFEYIAETGKFSEPTARYFFNQLLDALEYIHQSGWAHRDIKPENLLLDDEFNLKLADFGFATKEITSMSKKGTFGYMAPEINTKMEYN